MKGLADSPLRQPVVWVAIITSGKTRMGEMIQKYSSRSLKLSTQKRCGLAMPILIGGPER